MRARRNPGWWGATALAALTLGCGLETSGLGWGDGPWDAAEGGGGEAASEAEAAGDDGGAPDPGLPEAEAADVDLRDEVEASTWCGDGLVQPGEDCEPGQSESCTSTCGPGVRACSPICTWDTCRSTVIETCNGVDDDCTGRADDGAGMECVSGMEEPCGPCNLGVRTCSTSTCTWSACALSAPDACEPGTTEACAAPICGAGHRTCLPACTWGDCTPDVNECPPGTTRSCDGGDWCGVGLQTCGADCRWSACDGSPPWECSSRSDTRWCEKSPLCYGLNFCEAGCHWSVECHTLGC